MEIEFSHQYYTLMAALVIAVVIVYYLASRYFKVRVLRFGNFEVLEKVTGDRIRHSTIPPLILRILAVVFFILAASDPRIVEYKQVVGEDFVLTIDTSSSMLTPDFPPNRLEATKETAIRWISSMQNARVGVVTFAGKPYVRTEPTLDKEKVLDILATITTDSPAGTAIGEALISSAALLSDSETERNKTIILITDGRNNVGVSINDSLESLIKSNIRVYAVGIGTSESAEIVIPSELADKNATITEFPQIDEEVLQSLANMTGGKYARVEDMQSLKGVLLTQIETTETVKKPIPYLIFIASILLLLEWAIEITKYRPIP
ncbi:MAG: VWA domain-containing protein [Methanobacteriota archaeon]